MDQHTLNYYRLAPKLSEFQLPQVLSDERSRFQWGEGTLCYGRLAADREKHVDGFGMEQIPESLGLKNGQPELLFDPDEVIENLQRERYSAHFREPGRLSHTLVRKAYYMVRPLLSVQVRVRMQRLHLRNWNKIPFPEWPVDTTVDRIHRKLLKLAMKTQGVDKAPFIWFWPDGYTSCTIITHDVESIPPCHECSPHRA